MTTDPFLADSDNVGVPDAVEILEDDTDPSDPHSFKQRLTVSVTNTASLAHAVYAAWGFSPNGWETNGLATFPQGCGETTYTNASSHGATHVKAFCDLDGNGEYDAGNDILLVRAIPYGGTAQIKFTFGDVDGDGVADAQERDDQTDPYDANNFRLVATVVFADRDVMDGYTNLVAMSETNGTWINEQVVASFSSSSYSLLVDTNITTGILHVKCLRDFNGDRSFDPAHDVVYYKTLTKLNNGRSLSFTLGDHDYDGVLDSNELAEGTDPLRGNNYCFNLTAEFTGIFSTTNQLTAEVFFGTNRISGPFVMTSRTWSYGMEHLVASNHETAVVYFWEDVNANGLRESTEKTLTNRYSVTGHDMTVTNRLAYGAFDADGDGMLDSWELQHGLSPASAGDAVLDADGDGFINLYEFWAGTDPNDPTEDGDGTALYVATHAVDSRIIGKLPDIAKVYFNDFSAHASSLITNLTDATFSLNTNCWLHGVDLSCMSIWSDFSPWEWAEPLTLISTRHVMSSSHVTPTNGTRVVFRSYTGDLFIRTLIDSKPILGVAANDLCIGILDEPLPPAIKVARFLPSNYSSYIGTGRKLPYVRIGGNKTCNIEDVVFLAPTALQSRMIKIEHSSDPVRNQYKRGPVAMDSGHPIFFLFGNDLAFLCPTRGFYSDEPGATGFLCVRYLQLIKEAMDFLSDQTGSERQSMQLYDLSAFSTLENIGGVE